MDRTKVDKLECRNPALFKVMWLSTVVWIIVAVANYFGNWLLPNKLDGFGMSILFLFGISILCCFGRGIMNLISQHGIMAIDTLTRKVALYVFIASFAVLLVISIWELCGTMDSRSDFIRNGAVTSISLEAVVAIVSDYIKAVIFSIVIILFYWYVRICFMMFSGRIRRIGVEIAMALILLAYLCGYANNMVWVNIAIVLIAMAFLYDIWRIADFQEEQFQTNWIKKLMEDEE